MTVRGSEKEEGYVIYIFAGGQSKEAGLLFYTYTHIHVLFWVACFSEGNGLPENTNSVCTFLNPVLWCTVQHYIKKTFHCLIC